MMAIGLIEELCKEPQNTVAYFFCQNGNRELNTLESIIKGLIHELVKQHVELNASLRRRWDNKRERFTEDCTSWRNLWDILLEMLGTQCKLSNAYLVVDAPDECPDGGMAEFLRLVVRNGLDQPSLKWLLTSRPLDVAERALLTGHEQTQVSLELNSLFTSQAVKAYITHKVDELSSFQRYKRSLKIELTAELFAKAEGTFLWVSLVCKKLENVPRDMALRTIQDLPPGLHALYDRVMDQLRGGETDDVRKCMQLLKVMMLVYRPLNLAEIPVVTGLTDGDNESLINRCASFLRRQENNIEFVHQSTRDYLGKGNAQSTFRLYTSFGHHDISLACLAELSKQLKVNLVDLPQPDSTINTSESLDEERTAKLSSLGYAATFWVRHLGDADESAIHENETLKKVRLFLYTKFLEWLECLSLLGQLSLASESIEQLGCLAKSDSLTGEFLQDAARFLPRHHHTIKHWPLQIYSSAIIFSPKSSIVRRENLHKAPSYMGHICPMEDSWSLVIQTLDTDSTPPNDVAFSQDGKWVVEGNSSGNIKIWESAGSLSKTINSHSFSVFSVAISPDCQLIASGSDKGTIRLWSITGVLEKTLKGHSDGTVSVAFSPDNRRIASGSRDKTVKLWGVTGFLEQTLNGHSAAVTSVAFSPDSRRIASASLDRTVRIWNSNGDLEKVLEGHSGLVMTVAFSPDGRNIASGCSNCIIKIWNLTGAREMTLSGHSMVVRKVAFSPDGTKIVSGSWDGTLKFWTMAGELENNLELPGLLSKVAFSPDFKRAAVIRRDIHGIRIWNIASYADNAQRRFHESLGEARKLKLSPNGLQIASISESHGDLILWDATTGERQRTLTLERQYGGVRDVAFSPSGQLVSLASYRAIKIWSTTTGKLETILGQPAEDSEFSAISFHPDGVHVISCCGYGTLTAWNTKTATAVRSIEDKSKDLLRYMKHIGGLAASPCGEYIAIAVHWHANPFRNVKNPSIEIWSTSELFKRSKMRGLFSGKSSKSKSKPCKRIEVPDTMIINNIKFSADGQVLITNDGTVMLEDLAREDTSTTRDCCSILAVRDQWIQYNNFPFLRLPAESKPSEYNDRAVWDANDDTVAIGLENGRILVLSFRQGHLQSTFGQTP